MDREILQALENGYSDLKTTVEALLPDAAKLKERECVTRVGDYAGCLFNDIKYRLNNNKWTAEAKDKDSK